ncbi:MAG: 16S rRNA (adenine(1518)-N(6)/adenine(1519)-N(6))-dimethyltransferase RsmA [Candidatus Thalassarchaeaceae archaeon]|nr:16S rRNA (adenine(1518)-N(6)/adenine(1519)-N(6))-dimethyltransferase RsmA [Candidatus Thalassarchaeaceae archaeon]
MRKSENMSDLVPDGGEVVSELVDLLLDRIRVDKELGQHFLIDGKIIQKAVELSGVGADSHVLEVGPGPGTLTHFLLAVGARVTAIEIDEIAAEHLHRVHASAIESGQLSLIIGDSLRVRWPQDISHVVSNPPYQISSPLLKKIDYWQNDAKRRGGKQLQSVVLLLQDEFASRLAMEFGLASRGPLGINTALNWVCSLELKVPPHSFTPHPEVHSRLVTLKPHDLMTELDIMVEPRLVKRIVDHAFAERRKKIRNRLKGVPRKIERVPNWNRKRWTQAVDVLLRDADAVDLESGWEDFRPEDLEVDEWLILAQKLEHINNESNE